MVQTRASKKASKNTTTTNAKLSFEQLRVAIEMAIHKETIKHSFKWIAAKITEQTGISISERDISVWYEPTAQEEETDLRLQNNIQQYGY